MNQFAAKTAPGPRPSTSSSSEQRNYSNISSVTFTILFILIFQRSSTPPPHTLHHTTAPLHKFAFIFRHHKALKWNWIYNFSNICGLELAPLHSIPVLMYRIILRLLSVSSSSLCIFCTPGTRHMSRTDDHTRPLLRSEICHQPVPISPWRSGRATVLQCSGYINQKIAAHSITRPAHTFSTLWGHSLPSYQQEEEPATA